MVNESNLLGVTRRNNGGNYDGTVECHREFITLLVWFLCNSAYYTIARGFSDTLRKMEYKICLGWLLFS